MKVGKPKSKRVPVRLRHKIEKASAAKQRKQRKLAKKDPTWRTKLKKDPGIPNLFPYKDQILREVEENRRRKEEDETRRRGHLHNEEDIGDARDEPRDEAQMLIDEDSDALLDLGEDDEHCHDLQSDAIMDSHHDDANPMAALLASARARASKFDSTHDSGAEDGDIDEEVDGDESSFFGGLSPPPLNTHSPSARASHSTTMAHLISNSDVMLYVLDARDPVSTRSPTVEHAILSDPDKRMILILNKIDLIPPPVLRGWLTSLRKSFPTLPLQAGSSAPNVKTFNHKHLTPQFTSNALVKALKSYSTRQSSSRKLSVGVLGYPNVGKSSVINALTARLGGATSHRRGGLGKECPVGAEAGVTTALREVKLDGSIKLIDSPGIVFPSLASSKKRSKKVQNKDQREIEEQARLVLLNAIPARDVEDPVPAVSLLLNRLSTEQNRERFQMLLDTYGIPPIASDDNDGQKDLTADFLIQVARKRGRLGKGGVPNLQAAAQTVISDWRDGRIQSWVEPPEENGTLTSDSEIVEGGVSLSTKNHQIIVKDWTAEFKLDGLWENGEGNDGVGVL